MLTVRIVATLSRFSSIEDKAISNCYDKTISEIKPALRGNLGERAILGARYPNTP